MMWKRHIDHRVALLRFAFAPLRCALAFGREERTLFFTAFPALIPQRASAPRNRGRTTFSRRLRDGVAVDSDTFLTFRGDVACHVSTRKFWWAIVGQLLRASPTTGEGACWSHKIGGSTRCGVDLSWLSVHVVIQLLELRTTLLCA